MTAAPMAFELVDVDVDFVPMVLANGDLLVPGQSVVAEWQGDPGQPDRVFFNEPLHDVASVEVLASD